MVLREQVEKELGQILIEAKMITREQLVHALVRQKENGGCLAKNLVDLGYIKDIDIANCIAKEYRIPCVSLEGYKISEGLVNVIPENISNFYGVVPLDVIGEILIVGIIDTPNKNIMELLESLTGFKIQAMLITADDFNKYLQRVKETVIADLDKELENPEFGKYIKMPSYEGEERRRFLRFAKEILVKYVFQNEYFKSPSVNIGRGGILLKSDKPVPLKSHVKLKLALPDSNDDVVIISEAVRLRKEEGKDKYNLAFSFVSMSKEDNMKLVEFIKSLKESLSSNK